MAEVQSWLWYNSVCKGQPLSGNIQSLWVTEVSGKQEKSERSREGGWKNISCNMKCCYYSCGVLKFTPCQHTLRTLSWSRLHFQPVEDGGVLQRWRAVKRLWGDAGIKVLNAKPTIPDDTCQTCVNTLKWRSTDSEYTLCLFKYKTGISFCF